MNFQFFHPKQYTCRHVGSKFLRFNTDDCTRTSKNRWPKHLTVCLKMRNYLFLEEAKTGKYIHTWLRFVNLFATPRRKHIFVCIYSKKLLRLMTVSRHMQGLKLGPASQKQWNGLVLWLKFWLFLALVWWRLLLIIKNMTIQNHKLPKLSKVIAGLPISLVSELHYYHTCRVPSNQLA